MNKHERPMYLAAKRHHGKKFADWLYENKKLDGWFNYSWGWSHMTYMLAFALDKIPQIEPPLTKDERMSIY